MTERKRIVLGESGGPTPVIDWEVAGAVDRAQKAGWEVYGMINGLEGLLNADIGGNIVDLSGIDPMSFAFNGPGACLRTTRMKPGEAEYRRIADNIGELGIDAVIYFGGNDSAEQLNGLAEFTDAQLLHGIKTVDNDLPVTHHCPGYGSAALYNATALKNVHNDYSSYRVRASYDIDGEIKQGWKTAPVAIYQVMGRKAGWLAQGTGFAKVDPKGEIIPDRAPHIILSKEIPFDKEAFLEKLSDVLCRQGEAVVVVQEDLTDSASGKSIAEVYSEQDDNQKEENLKRDPFGHIQHGRSDSFSPAIFLAQLCKEELQVDCVYGEVKEVALVPQHIQRSCMMSAVDASEAYMVGAAAVDALLAGESGQSVILTRDGCGTSTSLTAMGNIAAKERSVPAGYINGMSGPTQGFIDEFIYLIGGPAALPHFSSRHFSRVTVPASVTKKPFITEKEKP